MQIFTSRWVLKTNSFCILLRFCEKSKNKKDLHELKSMASLRIGRYLRTAYNSTACLSQMVTPKHQGVILKVQLLCEEAKKYTQPLDISNKNRRS